MKYRNILEVFVDGACHNAPDKNHMGIGVHINFEGEEYRSFSEYAGLGTNNEAEYIALKKGLTEAHVLERIFKSEGIKIHKIVVNCDSQIVVNQFNGDWICREERLKPFLQKCWDVEVYPELEVKWIPREQNKRADVLSKQELKIRGLRKK